MLDMDRSYNQHIIDEVTRQNKDLKLQNLALEDALFYIEEQADYPLTFEKNPQTATATLEKIRAMCRQVREEDPETFRKKIYPRVMVGNFRVKTGLRLGGVFFEVACPDCDMKWQLAVSLSTWKQGFVFYGPEKMLDKHVSQLFNAMKTCPHLNVEIGSKILCAFPELLVTLNI